VSITTWTELKASVADFAHRSDLTTQIPDFITLCEARLNDMLLLKNMESDEALTLVTSQNYVALPTGYISPIAFWLVVSTVRVPIDFVLPSQLPYNPTNAQPTMVAVDADNLRFDSPSDSAYTAYLRCVKKSNLGASTASNYLLAKRPDIYLAGTLVELGRYTQDANLIGIWEPKFLAACEEVKNAENRNRGIVGLVNDFLRPGRRANILIDG
jgi:hypothetical protein